MSVERVPGSSSLIDVLDRVLDKGIVVDAWVRISLAGIDVTSEETRVIVASSDTNLSYDGSSPAGGFPPHAAPGDGLRQASERQVGARAVRRRR
jgi:gas vesicle structural protein